MTRNRPDPSLLFHPRMPANWWLRKRTYFLFIVREFTSVFIAAYLIVFLVQLYQLGNGPGAYQAFMGQFASPGWIGFHAVALAFAIYHSLTWFYTTSIVIPLRIGAMVAPRYVFTLLNVAVWLAVSAAILAIYSIW